MTLIDQRILIDAPIEVVWDHLADPDKLARWHEGYVSILILTTRRIGVGVRRRCALAGGGKDIIEEITAWMDRIGYEYTIVEGSAYRAFQARLRLQSVPDGILVQWTIQYKPKGLIGGITDRVSGRRNMAALMAASLRQLKRNIDQLGVRLDDTYRERVGIRGRLNVDERAEYQRRHAPPPGIDPIGPAPRTPPEPIPVAGGAPSFVTDLLQAEGEAEYSHTADTQPRKPEGLEEAIRQSEITPPSTPVVEQTEPKPSVPPPDHIAPPPPAPVPAAVDDDPTPPRGVPRVQPVFERPAPTPTPAQAMPPVTPADIARYQRPAMEMAPVEPPQHREGQPPQTPKTDTGEISIWEVFGMPRPSEQDSQSLHDLVQTVREREDIEAAETRHPRGFGKSSRIQVRHGARADGLRSRAAGHGARVRQRKK